MKALPFCPPGPAFDVSAYTHPIWYRFASLSRTALAASRRASSRLPRRARSTAPPQKGNVVRMKFDGAVEHRKRAVRLVQPFAQNVRLQLKGGHGKRVEFQRRLGVGERAAGIGREPLNAPCDPTQLVSRREAQRRVAVGPCARFVLAPGADGRA